MSGGSARSASTRTGVTEIIPAILTDDYQDLIRKFATLEGQTSWVQLDYVDGDFAPHKTLSLEKLTEVRGSFSVEIHVMSATPEEDLATLLERNLDRLVVPIETLTDPAEFLSKAKGNGFEVCFGLNPKTPVSIVEPHLSRVDGILLLSVEPGMQGQGFISETVNKISDIKALNEHIPIEVDGGLNTKIVHTVIAAGASRLVVGSAIWEAQHPLLELQHLRREAR
jgi:ribulose-phosphate 3-epimerase